MSGKVWQLEGCTSEPDWVCGETPSRFNRKFGPFDPLLGLGHSRHLKYCTSKLSALKAKEAHTCFTFAPESMLWMACTFNRARWAPSTVCELELTHLPMQHALDILAGDGRKRVLSRCSKMLDWTLMQQTRQDNNARSVKNNGTKQCTKLYLSLVPSRVFLCCYLILLVSFYQENIHLVTMYWTVITFRE